MSFRLKRFLMVATLALLFTAPVVAPAAGEQDTDTAQACVMERQARAIVQANGQPWRANTELESTCTELMCMSESYQRALLQVQAQPWIPTASGERAVPCGDADVDAVPVTLPDPRPGEPW